MRFVIAALFIAAWAMLSSHLDASDDIQITADAERRAREAKQDVTPQDMLWMRMPVECDRTWVAKCGGWERSCARRYTCAADLTRRASR